MQAFDCEGTNMTALESHPLPPQHQNFVFKRHLAWPSSSTYNAVQKEYLCHQLHCYQVQPPAQQHPPKAHEHHQWRWPSMLHKVIHQPTRDVETVLQRFNISFSKLFGIQWHMSPAPLAPLELLSHD